MAALKHGGGSRKIPGKVTLLSIIQACGSSRDLEKGRLLHGYVVQILTLPNAFIGNTLVSMYAKCGSAEDAWHVFRKLREPNVVSWSAMIAGYSRRGSAEEALKLYRRMLLEGMKPNEVTLLSVLVACTRSESLEQGKRFHSLILANGEQSMMILELRNALVSMYAKCGDMSNARSVFEQMASRRDVVSWNAVIAGYAQHGAEEEAIKLYHVMGEEKSILPDQVTYLAILPACGSLAALELGEKLHAEVLKLGFESQIEVGNSVMDMYAKCGCLDAACHLFQSSRKHNIASWSVIAAAYAQHGLGAEAVSWIERMNSSGLFEMDRIVFLSELAACSHSGLIEEGCFVLCSMERGHAVEPSEEHYACLVDLLGRAGLLRQARLLIRNMPCKPSLNLWRAFLGACRIHGHVRFARWAVENILTLEPNDSAASLMLCNITSSSSSSSSSSSVCTEEASGYVW